MTISTFGWADGGPPAIDAANLEAMLQVAGAYTDVLRAAITAGTALPNSIPNATGAANGTVPVANGSNSYTWQTAGSGGVGDLLAANNLSDLVNTATARANLSLGSAALQSTSAFDAAGAATTAANAAQAASLQKTSNLSDVASASTARTNLGLGSAATQASSAFDAAGAASTAQSASLQKTANLSDLASASTARSNLGLGTAATQAASAFDAAGTSATETTRAEAAEALLAPKASPTLTGTVTIPTPTTGDNTTKAASTAFVTAAVNAVLTALGAVTFAIREAGGSYVTRSSGAPGATSTSTVIWIGLDAPTIGGSYAINDVDIWIPTSV